ncbi:hypothetical protein H4219_003291 [Mycoemilia scoparia]|uniref:Association with the SNF1 complex (ASC) domain-containing protein n=1 Tax=Mycoemilia scoparia TaxID=417184 RepID=A0A9W7ZV96_9FUNG|nr:hypothetical protein H4219_003291 [Mycoemilia scoparia]
MGNTQSIEQGSGANNAQGGGHRPDTGYLAGDSQTSPSKLMRHGTHHSRPSNSSAAPPSPSQRHYHHHHHHHHHHKAPSGGGGGGGGGANRIAIGPMAADLLSPIVGSPLPESGFGSSQRAIPIDKSRQTQTVLPEVFPATLPNNEGMERMMSPPRQDTLPAAAASHRHQMQSSQGGDHSAGLGQHGGEYPRPGSIGRSPQPLPSSLGSNSGRQYLQPPQIHQPTPATFTPQSKLIPTLIRWPKGGDHVYVAGSFNDWRYKIKLHKTETEWQAVIDLPSGTHCIKFVVDDEWQCSNSLMIAPDDDGNLVNYINVDEHLNRGSNGGPVGLNMGLGGMEIDDNFVGSYENQNNTIGSTCNDANNELGGDDANVEGLDSSQLSGSPPGDYTNQIPDWNQLMAKLRDPSSSGGSRRKDPPMLPPHLNNVLLNHTNGSSKNDPNVLPVPNHVVLNHLYACSIKDQVMAVSTTSRYRGKYLTTIYYKPVNTPA